MREHLHRLRCAVCRTGVRCAEAREIVLARARKAEARRLVEALARRRSIVRAA